MKADKPEFTGPLEARLYRMAENYCARTHLSLRAFGADAAEDAEFFPDLARGRSPTLKTVDKILTKLGQAPVGPFFETEIDAFLEVTGTKRSALGRGATKNPSFVAHIGGGMSPELRTLRKVRVWMAKDASSAEAREILRRTEPLPDLLSDAPLRRRERPQRTSGPSAAGMLARAGGRRGSRDWDDLRFIDTKEAADFVGLKASTLARYRPTENGPPFFRFSERIVRYRREHLVKWEAARRR